VDVSQSAWAASCSGRLASCLGSLRAWASPMDIERLLADVRKANEAMHVEDALCGDSWLCDDFEASAGPSTASAGPSAASAGPSAAAASAGPSAASARPAHALHALAAASEAFKKVMNETTKAEPAPLRQLKPTTKAEPAPKFRLIIGSSVSSTSASAPVIGAPPSRVLVIGRSASSAISPSSASASISSVDKRKTAEFEWDKSKNRRMGSANAKWHTLRHEAQKNGWLKEFLQDNKKPPNREQTWYKEASVPDDEDTEPSI
jgi:hypothetical protein